jgi:hypothetical protein
MSNDNQPILYDFMIAVEKVSTTTVRIRDDMNRGWDRIEQRAIAMVKDGTHHGYSAEEEVEFRVGGSWFATESDQASGPFQMLPGYCRECGESVIREVGNRLDHTTCEACERKEAELTKPGLYAKYLVFRNEDDPIRNHVSDCFVLRPTTDDAAYDALWAYVDRIEGDPDKQQLADDLRAWLYRISDENRKKRVQEASEPEKQG